MGILSSILHPSRPYKAAQRELDRYYSQAQGYAQPYVAQGQAAYEPLSGAMQALLNPEQQLNQFAAGYETSPYAQDLIGRAMEQGLSSASSQGLLGSTPALQASQAGAMQIANADRDRYLDRLFNQYLTGAQLAQGLYGTGAQMSSNLMQGALGMGQNAAELAYGREAAGGNMLGNLLGFGVGLAGGPIGGALANRFIGPYQPNWNTVGGNMNRSPVWGGNY